MKALFLTRPTVTFTMVPSSPGFQAGMTPGMKVPQVNGEKSSLAGLKKSIQGARNSAITLVLQQGRRQITSQLDYHEGENYPHLRRVEGKEDLLDRITASKTQ